MKMFTVQTAKSIKQPGRSTSAHLDENYRIVCPYAHLFFFRLESSGIIQKFFRIKA